MKDTEEKFNESYQINKEFGTPLVQTFVVHYCGSLTISVCGEMDGRRGHSSQIG